MNVTNLVNNNNNITIYNNNNDNNNNNTNNNNINIYNNNNKNNRKTLLLSAGKDAAVRAKDDDITKKPSPADKDACYDVDSIQKTNYLSPAGKVLFMSANEFDYDEYSTSTDDCQDETGKMEEDNNIVDTSGKPVAAAIELNNDNNKLYDNNNNNNNNNATKIGMFITLIRNFIYIIINFFLGNSLKYALFYNAYSQLYINYVLCFCLALYILFR